MAPSVNWRFPPHGDSGDLAAAVATWGIPHPTGYPLYVLVGGVFAHLVPVGQIAYRLGLFSGLCAAGASVLVFLTVLRLAGALPRSSAAMRYGAALTAALALATSRTLWSQSVQAETYAQVALFAGLIAWIVAGPRDARRQVWGAALTGGFALAHHTTLGFSLIGAALALGLSYRNRLLQPKLMAGAVVLLLAPLSLYLLLPLRAAQHPASNWGDPTTFDRFIDVVTGAPYHHYLDHSLTVFVQGLPVAIRLLFTQFAWWILPFAVGGAAVLWDHDRPFAVHGLTVIALSTIFYTEYKADGRENYLIQADVLIAVFAGVGMLAVLTWAWNTARARWRRWLPAAAVVVAIVTVAPWAIVGLHDFNLRGDWKAWNFATTTLNAAPPHGTVTSDQDGHTFALWYAQRAGHVRPDVTVIDPRFKDPAHQR
ncbi:MAG TPA: DUF2723 domain-containing protein [Dehalococcoidia bacterium]|nr:DUF2723 domain-containing protein [Dehalococcoidia bacterium]